MNSNNIVPFGKRGTIKKAPQSNLCKMRESDKLINEWYRIHKTYKGEDKVMQVLAWRDRVHQHMEKFKGLV